jgi:hypothetical protein
VNRARARGGLVEKLFGLRLRIGDGAFGLPVRVGDGALSLRTRRVPGLFRLRAGRGDRALGLVLSRAEHALGLAVRVGPDLVRLVLDLPAQLVRLLLGRGAHRVRLMLGRRAHLRDFLFGAAADLFCVVVRELKYLPHALGDLLVRPGGGLVGRGQLLPQASGLIGGLPEPPGEVADLVAASRRELIHLLAAVAASLDLELLAAQVGRWAGVLGHGFHL